MNVAVGLFVAALGSLSAMAAPLWAQAASDPVSSWIPAGSAGVAVGGLVYVAKKLAGGELVAVNIAEVLATSQRIAQQAVEMMAAGAKRDDEMRDLVVASVQAMTANTAALAELTRSLMSPPRKARTPAAKKSTR